VSEKFWMLYTHKNSGKLEKFTDFEEALVTYCLRYEAVRSNIRPMSGLKNLWGIPDEYFERS
jgi:hypothetical protein